MRNLDDFLINNEDKTLLLFSGLNCKSIKHLLVLMSVLCSPMERDSLAKGQSQGINSVVKYLLPGIELENKYILISDFCVEFFFFSFILLFFKKFPRITFKKINCWAKLTVGLLACKYQCDNLDLE